MKGFSGLPVDYQKAVKQMGDSLFLHTSYSFHSAVKRTMEYAQDIIIQNEGKVMEKEVKKSLKKKQKRRLLSC